MWCYGGFISQTDPKVSFLHTNVSWAVLFCSSHLGYRGETPRTSEVWNLAFLRLHIYTTKNPALLPPSKSTAALCQSHIFCELLPAYCWHKDINARRSLETILSQDLCPRMPQCPRQNFLLPPPFPPHSSQWWLPQQISCMPNTILLSNPHPQNWRKYHFENNTIQLTSRGL